MTTSNELRGEAHKLIKSAQDDLTAGGAELEARADEKLLEAGRLEARADKMDQAREAESRLNAIDFSKRPVAEARAMENTMLGKDDAFRHYLKTGEVRAQGLSTGGAGGYTVPQDFYDELIVSQIQWNPMLDGNVTKVIESDNGRPLPVPLLNDTGNKGFLISENTQINSANSYVFSQVTLNAYAFSTDVVPVSVELLQDTALDIQSEIISAMSGRYGRVTGTYLVSGTGSSQPTGIVTAISAANTVTNTANVATIEFNDIYNALHGTEPAYRNNPKFAWMMSDATLLALRKIKDNYGRYILDSTFYQGANVPVTLLGQKIIINQAMAGVGTGNIPILVGDFNGFAVRKIRGFEVVRLNERYADFRQVGFVGFGRLDSALLDNRAIRGLKVS